MVVTTTPAAPPGDRAGERVLRWRAAVAGAVAAAVALAAGELPSALAGESESLVTAVANRFVDSFAASLKDLAVALFGTGDKVALVVGIVIVSVALGARVGVAAAGRPWVGPFAFAAFGAVGAWSAATDPQLGTGVAVASALVAIGTGVGALAVLLPFAVARVDPGPAAEDPRVRTPDRRAFLAFAGTAGVGAALAASAGRSLRRGSIEDVRAGVVLPRPVRADRVPADTGVSVEGISPYVTPNGEFYRIDTAITVPQVDPAGWRLRVHGLVERPYELGYGELLAMDLVEEAVTLQCVSNEVGGDLVGNAVWLGVPLADVLDRAGVRPEGTQIVGRSVDDFTVGMPTAVALDGRTALVAVGMNGEPLPARHGFPARLVVSGLYGYVSATKWLSELELVRYEDFDAYWVPRGWAKEAPIKLASRIDVPRDGRTLDAGRRAVAGVAWSPHVGIEAVEVRIGSSADDGRWERARLGRAAGVDTWVQWVHEWDAVEGEHEIRVRALDRHGNIQTGETAPPRPDGATGHHSVRVRVR